MSSTLEGCFWRATLTSDCATFHPGVEGNMLLRRRHEAEEDTAEAQEERTKQKCHQRMFLFQWMPLIEPNSIVILPR